MNKEQATQILKQALASVRATVQEHNLYAQALQTLLVLAEKQVGEKGPASVEKLQKKAN